MPHTSNGVVIPVSQCRRGNRVVIEGTIGMVTVSSPHAECMVQAYCYDKSGEIEIIWLGRHVMPGVGTGRQVRIVGRVSLHGRDLAIYNPHYELLS